MHLKGNPLIYGSEYMGLEKTSASKGGFGSSVPDWFVFLTSCFLEKGVQTAHLIHVSNPELLASLY